MKKIEFIYFDIGGVLLLDFSGTNKWYEMKKDLGFTDESIQLFDKLWVEYTSRVNLDYDIDDFAQVLRDNSNANIPENYSMLQDFINRFDKNNTLEELASGLLNKYQVGLLTNMYPRMLNKINEHNLIPKFKWNAVVDSSIVGYQKPDSEIYEIAEKMAGVKPEEILFIDNLEKNLIAAKERGWNVFLYDPTDSVKSTKELAKFMGIDN